MATKDKGLFLNKQQLFSLTDKSCTNDSSQFSNFSLNACHKFSDDAQIFSKSKSDKSFGYTVTDHCHEQRKSWNKSTKDSCLSKTTSKNSFFNEKEESQNSWKNDSKNSNAKNASTLSLHIAAYENSTEAASDESEDFSKKSKTFKSVVPSLQKQQDFVEFPRQMEANKPSKPEVQQFKASQKLASPNQGKAATTAEAFEVEEKAENITGWFYENYIILAPADDSIKRYYGIYSIYTMENPQESNFVYIPQPNSKRVFAEIVMSNTLAVLKKLGGRSRHFPRYKHHGLIKKLVFGYEGFNEEERDPEWTNRPFIIINHEHVPLSSMLAFSEHGYLPIDLALHVGLGMAFSLAALHQGGFIHRYVTPHSFSYQVPITLASLSSRMIITDMSLCMEYPYKNGPRITVPFVGCNRYSSIRAHNQREQGPADDYISMIYVISEMINGKLPWRSIYDRDVIHDHKIMYKDSTDFKRLPREIRKLYHDLILKNMAWIDPAMVIDAFQSCISRRDPDKSYELPKWLVMPSAN